MTLPRKLCQIYSSLRSYSHEECSILESFCLGLESGCDFVTKVCVWETGLNADSTLCNGLFELNDCVLPDCTKPMEK